MAIWFTLIGVLFVGMALVRTHLRHLPVTTALVYLVIGAVLGALGLIKRTPWGAPEVLEIGAEIAVIVSLFTPAAVWLGLAGSDVTNRQRHFISWFGIRGIGSLYYLVYALNHGLGDLPEAELVASLTVGLMAIPIVLHGISVTPLMDRYREPKEAG